MTAVAIAGVRKSFGTNEVLHGVDLDVASGSFTAILGASGSGKTTLLRILAGFERAGAGVVRIGDVVVDGPDRYVPAEERHVGYVSQEGSLFPHLDVAANVGFGLDRKTRRSGVVNDLLELVGMGEFAARYPHQLSGGQQQRVAIARALAVKPRLVLLDEPFASLDAHLRATVRAEVRSVLAESGATVVLVTHDQDEALSMADHVAILRVGHIVQTATPEQLYEQPADAELARFVGQANVIVGTRHGDRVQSALGELQLDPGLGLQGPGAQVLVRPEHIEFVDDAGVAAQVVGLEYHGHDATVFVHVEGLDDDVIVRTLGVAAPSVGDKVHLAVVGSSYGWDATG